MTTAWLWVLGASAAALSLAATAGTAAAAGFYSQEQSVRGLGAAHSGEVADTGADALWWNPAAIAGSEDSEAYVGVHAILADAAVRDQRSFIARPFAPIMSIPGSANSDPVSAHAAPNLAVSVPVTDRWSVGLAVATPFGFVTSVEPESWTRYQALQLRMVDVDLQPTVAFRAASWLDFGAGLDAELVTTRLATSLPNLSPLASDGAAVVKGRGWNAGWVVGATVRPYDRLSIGVSFRARIEHRLKGHVSTQGLLGPLAAGNGVLPSVTRFTTPAIFTFGVRWRVAERWTLSTQVQRSGWSAFDTIQVDREGGKPQPSRDARNTTSVALGAEYEASDRWTVRAGIQFDPQAIADSAMLADGDRLILAAGATFRPRTRLSLDLAAAYVRFKTSPIDSDATAFRGTALETPITLLGEFSAKAPILSAGVRWRF